MALSYIDLRWMIPGYAGGMEVQSRALVNTLLNSDPSREFTLLIPVVVRYDFNLRGHPNFHLQICDGPGSYWNKLEWRILKRRANRVGKPLDGIWVNGRRTSAEFAISLSGIISQDLYPLKNIVLVNDIQHEYLPDFFDSQEFANRKRDFNASVCHARKIITISQFSRATLVERYSIPSAQIIVASPSVAPVFQKATSSPDKIWEKYHLQPGSYLYYPANTWIHKNHRLILQALATLRDRHAISLPFVCTGAPKEAHTDLLALSEELGLQEEFRFLGFCPQAELPALYRGALALVYPSLFEGFGMPVLEAMACECPVICSNTTSLPEAAGQAALFIEPDQPESMANAILQILNQPDLRANLVVQGLKQVERFSWSDFASAFLQSLDELQDESQNHQKISILHPTVHRPNEKNLDHDHPDHIGRTALSRSLLSKSVECFRQQQIAKAAGAFFLSAITGPDVVLWIIIYPFIRDKFLRRLLNKFG